MELILRQYTACDSQAVWALHRLASQAARIPEPEGHFSDLEDIESAFLQSGGEFAVGECDGRIIAMGGLKRTAKDRAEIVRMRVHPDYQRRAFGSILLRHLETRAAAFGYRTLHLVTLAIQESAQKLYYRNGYRCLRSGFQDGFEVLYFEKSIAGG